MVECLVAAGADVQHAGNEDGATPLHEAARTGHRIIAERLLELGASVNATYICTKGELQQGLPIVPSETNLIRKG